MQVTQHFGIEEFACRDGTAYPISKIDELDPARRGWLITRLMPLCQMLEVIRREANERCCRLAFVPPPNGFALTIDSGYRTIRYDEMLYERSLKNGDVAPATSSQHPKGRAADVRHAVLSPADLHAVILCLFNAGKLPALGGLGRYPHFCHIDVRPRDPERPDRLAQWMAGRSSNQLV